MTGQSQQGLPGVALVQFYLKPERGVAAREVGPPSLLFLAIEIIALRKHK